MAACQNCEHPVSLHGAAGCSARIDELSRPCGCGWNEEGESAFPWITLAAVAQLGDTVLISFDRLMSDEEFTQMAERLRPLKDQLAIQIGLIEGAASMVVVKGGGDGASV